MSALEHVSDAVLETQRVNLTKGCLLGLEHHAAGTLHKSTGEKSATPFEGLALSWGMLLKVEAEMRRRGLTVP